MMRIAATLTTAIAVATALSVLSGCPDPCVFLGGGCNNNDDCGAGQLCRKARTFESPGCAIVEGRCQDFDDDESACGSVDDCDEGECCDPTTNRCVGEVGYTSLDCDEFTCEDCNDTAFGDRCETNSDCDDDEACSADGINSFGTIEEKGVCRPSCLDDSDCPFGQSCNSSVCSVPVGTPCTLVDAEDEDASVVDEQCLGLSCTRLDADNERIDDGYCTDFCFEQNACPAGFVCDETANECRKL